MPEKQETNPQFRREAESPLRKRDDVERSMENKRGMRHMSVRWLQDETNTRNDMVKWA